MKVRLLHSFANPDIKMAAGQILDLPEATAQYYVEHGKAKYVDFPKATVIVPPIIEKATHENREKAIVPIPVEKVIIPESNPRKIAQKIKPPEIQKAKKLAHDFKKKK